MFLTTMLEFMETFIVLQLSYICHETKYIQLSMLGNIYREKIFIHKFDNKRFPKTMLSFWSYIIISLTVLYSEVVSNIQCFFSYEKHCFNVQGIPIKYCKLQKFNCYSLQRSYIRHPISTSLDIIRI